VEIAGDGSYRMGKIIKGAALRRAVAGWLDVRRKYKEGWE
jgi:hypothetical protein